MIVLVDYDNTPATFRTQPARLITTLVGVFGGVVPGAQSQTLHFRLYGGWDTFGGVATPLAQTVSAQLQGALPYSVPPVTAGGVPMLVTAELVRTSLWLPIPLADTFRPRHPGQRGIRGVLPLACTNNSPANPCQLHAALAILNQAQCSATCAVQPHDAVAKDEQKQVDTCIVVDMVHQAFMGAEPVALVSSDDDMWPGIFAAASLGKAIVHVHTRTPSACSLHYEMAVLARGHAYKRTQI